MTEKDKSKGQPQKELTKLRQRIAELEKLETERKKLEETLQRSEKQASAAIEAARALTFSYDIATGKIDWGGAIEKITGYTKKAFTKIDIKEWAERIHPDDRDEILSILQKAMQKDRATAEYRFRTKKGYVILSSISLSEKENGKPIRLVGIMQDITKQKEMQERLARSEKLAVLGQLAGGVSHELRNPLGSIKTSAYFLKMAIEKPGPEIKKTLDLLDKEVRTSEKIINSLFDFAPNRLPILKKANVNNIILQTQSRNSRPKNINIVNQLDKKLPHIHADPDQLFQIFSNIILNAFQAMPEGGRLIIKSKVPSPRWVDVSFIDTGEGIPKENICKLFEPLFTTKAKGIGLGLAITKTLVDGHGGTIEVESEVGKGSTFSVRLPISGEVEEKGEQK